MFNTIDVSRRVLFFACVTLISLETFSAGRTDFEDWLNDTEPRVLLNLLRNISPFGTAPGAVIASPSRREPNYYYHWVRDASLVIDVIVEQYAHTTNARDKALYRSLLNDFVQFSRANQGTWNLSGGLGEPKFNVDGTAFNEPWGRPQNDGPALRALALTRVAFVWIAEGKKKLSALAALLSGF